MAVVQDLKQNVEHIGVGLLHLIEEHHTVGLAAHCFGELAALVIPHISRRGTDETGHREFLHVFGHIDAHQVVFIVKEAIGQRFGQLGFAHTGGAQEQEAADGPARIGDTSPGTLDGFGDKAHRFILAHHPFVDHFVQVQQLLPFSFHQTAYRDAGPFGYNVGDLPFGDGVVHQSIFGVLFAFTFSLLELFFQRRQIGVFQLGGLFVFQVVLGLLDLTMHLLDLALQLFHPVHTALFGLPEGFHGIELVFLLAQFLGQLLETVFGQLIFFLLQGHFLDLLLHDLPPQVVQLSWHGVDLSADHGAGFVHQVNGLVRQETVGDVPMG